MVNVNEQAKSWLLWQSADMTVLRHGDHAVRKIFKKYFGIKSDPFDSCPKGTLNPLFKIED